MKHRVSLVILLCISGRILAADILNDSILQHLDAVVAQRQTYIDKKEQRINQTKELTKVATGETLFRIYANLFEEYNGFNTDSALRYSQLMQEEAKEMHNTALLQQADICYARCLAINGIYELAKEILIPMESELCAENKANYYKVCSSMYIWEADFTTLQDEKQVAWDHIPALRDSTIRYEPNAIWRTHEQALLIGGSYPQGGISLLLPVLDSLGTENDYLRFVTNSLGSFYNSIGQTDSALYYYGMSAIADLENGITEYVSLREVALLLLKKGDVERALQYMKCCIEDAAFCKARLRTIEMAGDMPIIIEAYRKETRAHQQWLHFWMISLVILLLLILVILFVVFLMARRLARAKKASDEAREQLHENNQRLEQALQELNESNSSLIESNRIKETYVLQYMRECSETFGILEQYHQDLLHIAMRENYKKLQDAVKSSDFIEQNEREFYLHFDETFLSLFPNFVEDLNSLLRPEEQFALPQGKRLSTELRIIALIRLGVVDSEEIARFLRLSTKTVYNYRTAVRNRAAGKRDELRMGQFTI